MTLSPRNNDDQLRIALGRNRQKQIVDLLKNSTEPALTVKEISEQTLIDESAVWKNLQYLHKRGIVIKNDETQPHRYQLAD